ncbi:MAG: L-aspartate oxidase [Planctomycetes bacterium]|nr:L-aspartate oxidase [Planctomycetota bacterium]
MGKSTPRYLAAFDPKRLPHYFTDVLVIGGGLAGLRAANAVDPDWNVLVATKDLIDQSNSSYAQGGIAGVIDKEDRFESHVADTLAAGGPLCDRRVVEMVVREAPDRIRELIDWGTRFDQTDGGLRLGREGGHGYHRIVHALGDATGKEVMRAVIERTRARPNISIWENAFTLDLLTGGGQCRGAVVVDSHGRRCLVWAKQTILSTGGAGRLFRESTNPPVATGDGVAMAYRAGAQLRDLEFMQFHPTVLYIAGSSRSLITEAIRGEGGRLVDCTGHRFMTEYDARGELAPRDVVSQAIVTQMEKTLHPCVYLDLSSLDARLVRERFPGIDTVCRKFGLDLVKDPIPVRPGAHYMIGGVTVDAEGRTTLPGLWAAGEVTSSGLHGANRLASNSLLEGLVFGVHAGEGASAAARSTPDELRAHGVSNGEQPAIEEPLDLDDIRNSLQSLMWRAVGVRRTRAALAQAWNTVEQWHGYVLVRQFDDPSGWELQNMLTVARGMVRAALLREESRGVHLRTDFPESNDAWLSHISHERDEATGTERHGRVELAGLSLPGS